MQNCIDCSVIAYKNQQRGAQNTMTTAGKTIAYLRTSSSSNVRTDKDGDRRQRDAIASFAKRAGYEIFDEFYDAAASAKDPIEGDPASRYCSSALSPTTSASSS
jgi:hypothetical protein